MKEPGPARTDSKHDNPFKTGSSSDGDPASSRVNFRQQSLVATQQAVRQLITARPTAKPTFRVTLGR